LHRNGLLKHVIERKMEGERSKAAEGTGIWKRTQYDATFLEDVEIDQ
jgi:hypothetical protein